MRVTEAAADGDTSTTTAQRDDGKPRAFILTAVMTSLVMIVIACLLPHDRYIQFQTLRGTLHDRSSWVYERIHFDPTPIDVVIVGSSRVAAGVDQLALRRDLRAIGGLDLHVANLAFAQPGYDLEYVVLREALEARTPRLVVVGISEHGARSGHPAFKDLASVGDFLDAPPVVNWSYFPNLAALPTRQVKLAADTLLAPLLGFTRAFDPGRYPGPDIDLRHRFPVDLDPAATARARGNETLDQTSQRYVRASQQVHFPAALADYEFAAERVYIRRMKALADAKGVKLVFLYVPFFKGTTQILDQAFYKALGPVLVPPQCIIGNASNFADPLHLNYDGSAQLSSWLARVLAPALGSDAAAATDCDGPA